MKDLIDQIIAQEFNAPDIEFSFGAEDSVDPQAQETILSSYTSKGILTINEARAALGRDPLAEPAANRPMALTGNGYVPLGQVAQTAGKAAGQIAKFNPYHDERGRFTTADNAATTVDHSPHGRAQIAQENSSINFSSHSESNDDKVQLANISCDDLWASDFAICHSVLFADDPHYYKQCMIGLSRRYDECLAGLPLSPLLPY